MVGRSDSARIFRKELVDSGWSMEAPASPISVSLPNGLHLRVGSCGAHVSRRGKVAEDTREEENI